jgi:hypothetical protein
MVRNTGVNDKKGLVRERRKTLIALMKRKIAVTSNGKSKPRVFQKVRSKEGIIPGRIKRKTNGSAKPNLTQTTIGSSVSFRAFLDNASVLERQKAENKP